MDPKDLMIDWNKTTVMDTMVEPVQAAWFEDANDYGRAESEYGWVEDAEAYHHTAVIGSWNMLARVKITGPDAEEFFQGIITNSWNNFEPGCVKHALCCNTDGKLVCNGLLIYLAEHEFIYTTGPRALWPLYLAKKSDLDVDGEVIYETSWSISGKSSVYACEAACGESLRDLEFMHFKYVTIDGIKCRCIRQSMTSEWGYEFQAPIQYSDQLKEALMKAGEPFGVVFYGDLGCLTQEVESGFMQEMCDFVPAIASQSEDDIDYRNFEQQHLPGMWHFMIKRKGSFEYDDPSALYRSPMELGEGAMVKFDHDFVGREAVEAEHADPKRVARTLVWNAEDFLDIYRSYFELGEEPYQLPQFPHCNPICYIYADKVLNKDGREIGFCTRPCYSPHYRCYVTAGTIEAEYAEIGTELIVVFGDPGKRQKWIRATVAPLRFKEDHRRDDMSNLPSWLGKEVPEGLFKVGEYNPDLY